MNNKTVGQRIAQARVKKGWSQSDLARAIDVVPATICILEGGKGSTKHIAAIARALGVSADWLDTGKGPQGSISASDARALLRHLKDLVGEFDEEFVQTQSEDVLGTLDRCRKLIARIEA